MYRRIIYNRKKNQQETKTTYGSEIKPPSFDEAGRSLDLNISSEQNHKVAKKIQRKQ